MKNNLPYLTGQAEQNRTNYLSWLEEVGMTPQSYQLSWIDIDLAVRDIIKAKGLIATEHYISLLTEWFEEEYTSNFYDSDRNRDSFALTSSKLHLGKLALKFLQTSSEWYQVSTKAEFFELLFRCYVFDFKNNKRVKHYFENEKHLHPIC